MTISEVLKMFKRKELAIAIEDNEDFYKLMDILDDNGYHGDNLFDGKKLSPKEYANEDAHGEWDYLFCANSERYGLDKCNKAYLKNGFLHAKTIRASDIKDLSSAMCDVDDDIYFYI